MDEQIKYFCKQWNITEFSLFGSVLTEKFNENSDVDVLVSFKENTSYGFFELARMKEDLEKIFGKKVDLLTKRGLDNSSNYFRNRSILSNIKLIYAER